MTNRQTLLLKLSFDYFSLVPLFIDFLEEMFQEVLSMSIDLKQHLDVIDYFGALVVWIIFFSFVFIVSVTVINWCCIAKYDDVTVLEEVRIYADP